jgi:hypothetical protein
MQNNIFLVMRHKAVLGRKGRMPKIDGLIVVHPPARVDGTHQKEEFGLFQRGN